MAAMPIYITTTYLLDIFVTLKHGEINYLKIEFSFQFFK